MFDEEIEGAPTSSPALGRFLVIATPGGNHAESLANYINGHGLEAIAADNEVTCPFECDCDVQMINDLASTWTRWWAHRDEELYALPLFQKDGTFCVGDE